MPAYDDTTGMMSSAPGALNVPAGALDQQGLLALLQQMQSGEPSAAASRSARTQGLLQAALGVLGNSYVPYGHSGMEGVAAGLGQGLTGYQSELDRQKALVADKFKYASLASELQKKITLQQAVKDAQADPTKLGALKTLYAGSYPELAAKEALAAPKTTAVGAGGSLLGPQGQVLGTAPPVSKLLTPEELAQQELLRRSGSTKITLSQTGEKGILSAGGGAIGARVDADYTAAAAAVPAIDGINRMRAALDTGLVKAGPGATFKQTAAQWAAVAGLGGDEKGLAATRQVMQGLADFTLQNRAILRGQGTISDSETRLLEKARGGAIDELTMPEIKVIMDVNERIQRAAINRHNTVNRPGLKDIEGGNKLLNFYPEVPAPPVYQTPKQGPSIDDLVAKHLPKR